MFQHARPLAIAAALFTAPAQADLLVYEPFDYSAGTEMNGLAANGLNLTGPYSTSSIQDLEISSLGLNYGSISGAPAAIGNRLNDTAGVGAGNVSVSLANPISTAPGSEIYFSALFTFDDSTNGNRLASIELVDSATGDLIRFGEAGVGVRAIRIEANTAALGGQVANGADGSFTDGQTLWLIGRYANSAALGADSLQLLGYDTGLAQLISPVFDFNDPNAEFAYSITGRDIDLAQISSLTFNIRGDNNNFIDELRIGTTYASVAAVPEPAAPALLFLTLATAAGLRRAKTRRASGA